MTSSNGNIFRLTGLCAGNSTVHSEFPTQRPVMQSFDVSFDLQLNERLSKQAWDWWFEMPLRSLWCHRNILLTYYLHSLFLLMISSKHSCNLQKKYFFTFCKQLVPQSRSILYWIKLCIRKFYCTYSYNVIAGMSDKTLRNHYTKSCV